MLRSTRLVSFFPAHAAWTTMWTRWDAGAIDDDLSRIERLGANTVRLIVPAWTFGFPRPRRQMLERLDRTVALSWARGLRVELTLFDWWSSYDKVAESEEWVQAVLRKDARDPRIAFVELKNEIDPGDAAAMRWARRMVPVARRATRGVPVTLSVSDAAGTAGLHRLKRALVGREPDFYTYHFYAGGHAELAYATLKRARGIGAPAPLFVGETGAPTAGDGGLSDLPTARAREAHQAHYFRTVEYAALSLRLPAAAPWTLNDLRPSGVPAAAGLYPGSGEYFYGLYRGDGRPKAAARAIANLYRHRRISTTFNNGFERGFRSAAGSLPLEWRPFRSPEGCFARDASVAHRGDASARLSATGGDATGAPSFYVSPVGPPVVAGDAYRASAWVKGRSSTGDTRVSLSWFDASGRYLGQRESKPLRRGSTEWSHLTARGPAPPLAAAVEIHLKSSRNVGTVWFDDVSFGRS